MWVVLVLPVVFVVMLVLLSLLFGVASPNGAQAGERHVTAGISKAPEYRAGRPLAADPGFRGYAGCLSQLARDFCRAQGAAPKSRERQDSTTKMCSQQYKHHSAGPTAPREGRQRARALRCAAQRGAAE